MSHKSKSQQGFFQPERGYNRMPAQAQFKEESGFLLHLLHEMTHSTGTKERLDRLEDGGTFGDESYAREELTAELTAAFTALCWGYPPPLKRKRQLPESWLDTMKKEP